MLKLTVSTQEDGLTLIFFSIGDRFFPSKNWSDHIGAIRCWADCLDEDGSSGALPFFDGPFKFEVTHSDGGYLFDFIEQFDGQQDVVFRYVASAVEYADILSTVSSAVMHKA